MVLDLSKIKSGDTVRIDNKSSAEFHGREVILLNYIAAGQWEVKTRGNNRGFINEEDIEEVLL